MKKLVTICLAILFTAVSGTAMAKTVYLSADHHTRQFDAWDIGADGKITKQSPGTYWLNYATDPAGIGIDGITGVGNDPLMFVTTEGTGGIEVINPVTLEFHGVAPGPTNMGGVDVDDEDNIIFAIRRGYSAWGGYGTNQLYVYTYNDDGSGIAQLAQITLPNFAAGFSLALDDGRDILWVPEYGSRMVKAYDVNVADWNDISEIPTLSFSVSLPPIDVAVDGRRNIVYTVGGWAGSPLLSRYDVATQTETTVNLGIGGIGCAVDEITGYVYLTRGTSSYGDDIQVWDCSTSPFTLIQDTGRIGNPAGICIANERIVGVNPLSLAKNDVIVGTGIAVGDIFTYEITCDNFRNPTEDATNVTITDYLPLEVDYISNDFGGIYDSATHEVFWDIGTIAAGNPGPEIELVVQVNQNAVPGSTIDNLCTVRGTIGGEDNETTVSDQDPCDTTDEPGINVELLIDIYPNRVPNRIYLTRNYTIYVAILGSANFDVATVNHSTVRFGAGGTEATFGRAPLIRDINRDGHIDAMYGFLTFDCGFAGSETEGVLTCDLTDGTYVEGKDSIVFP